ncbi:MAG: calcium-binding protein [Pseudomonadota bacterium]
MLEGTGIRLQVFGTDRDTASSRPVKEEIDDDTIEFDDVSFFDIAGDRFFVVAAQFDVAGTTLHYKTLEGGSFANVDDDTGFNGYKVTFNGIKNDDAVSIRSASIVDGTSTFGLPDGNLDTTQSALWINVDGLRFANRDTLEIRLNLDFKGDGGRDVFLGGDGRDRVDGKGGADVLAGGRGRDRIDGGRGKDFIDGGSGKDELTGGSAADTFVIGTSRAKDTITDFEVEKDLLLVAGTADRFKDIDLKKTDDGVLVNTGDGRVLLEDVSRGDIEADHFLF